MRMSLSAGGQPPRLAFGKLLQQARHRHETEARGDADRGAEAAIAVEPGIAVAQRLLLADAAVRLRIDQLLGGIHAVDAELLRFAEAVVAPQEGAHLGGERILRGAAQVGDGDAGGIGLAAPQIGWDVRLFVMDAMGVRQVLVNPVVRKASKAERSMVEGCLSLPGIAAPVDRPEQVCVQAQKLDGQTFEMR